MSIRVKINICRRQVSNPATITLRSRQLASRIKIIYVVDRWLDMLKLACSRQVANPFKISLISRLVASPVKISLHNRNVASAVKISLRSSTSRQVVSTVNISRVPL